MEFDSLKGFRDFYPGEMAARREVWDTVHDVARRYGFREVGTPSLESLELYEVKSGEEIVDETYSFEDKGGRRVTMTPELTPSLVRMFVSRQQAMAKPVRWYSIPKLWRYEQPQSGRLREFVQPNFDVYGVEGAAADAELVAFAHDLLTKLGLSDEFELRISHRGIVQGYVERYGLSEEAEQRVYRVVDKSERLSDDELAERLRDAGLDDGEVDEILDLCATGGAFEPGRLDDVVGVDSDRVDEAVDRLRDTAEELDRYGVLDSCVFDPSVVRGLDYYTGLVFECFDVEGDLRAIFGGGRYDDLVEEFGGQPTPAVGFGMGDATLQQLLERADAWPEERAALDYYVAVVGDVRDTAVDVAASLRDDGHVVELDVTDRGFGDQLEHADRVGAERTVIVGERDLADGEVTVKEMESGDQRQVPVEELL